MIYCLPVEFYTLSERRDMIKKSRRQEIQGVIVNLLGSLVFLLIPLVVFIALI